MHRYRAFGATIESDVALPALVGATGTECGSRPPIAIRVRPGGELPAARGTERPWYRAGDAGELLRITVDDAGDFRCHYVDGARFLIRAHGDAVVGRWDAPLTLEDAAEYLLGPIIGFALRLRGVTCLHASAIAVGNACFAVLAPSGHGKSTTAAACARLGLPVLTDDVLALRRAGEAFWAQPSYPRVRLWPEAAAGLFGCAEALPRLSPTHDTWDKRYLDLSTPGYRFQRQPLPLRRIYIPDLRHRARPSLQRLARAEALVELLANVYTRSRPGGLQRAREFAALDRLARQVPVERVRGPVGIEHLSDVCRLLQSAS